MLQVENLIGGMRGLKAMLWEASVLDPNEVSPVAPPQAYITHAHPGDPIPRTKYSRLSGKATSRKRWKGAAARKHALAIINWGDTHGGSSS
jgi:hypothetical protein